MSEDEEVIREFLVECREMLDSLDREFVALETDPASLERLASIFRTIHSIKGTSGFLGFVKLEKLTHAGESLLVLLRDGTKKLTPTITSGLLAMVDGVRRIVAHIEEDGQEGPDAFESLIAHLHTLQGTGAHDAGAQETKSTKAQSRAPHVSAAPRAPSVRAPSIRVVEHTPLPPAPAVEKRVPDALAELPQPAREVRAAAETSIRVDVGLLDKLMNLVGELVLARNQILQFGSDVADASFLGTSQRLNLITTELQEGVMKTRMQPIGNVWNKLPRVVRDLALHCGKEVRLEMEGAETELDRTILEAIKDPLTHVVRNSVDHGIETPAERIARGKAPVGTLKLRAFHEGGKVNIEISDDGAGIDAERVRAKAVQKGLLPADRAARMGERECHNLVFLPGFSTAAAVTNLSGRGVGMDVVKTNIERIGGTVELQSRPGLGLTLRIKIPLTLAIIPALVVTSGSERYAIPQVNLLELVRLDSADTAARIERIQGTPVYRLRGNLLPLVYLSRVLGQPEPKGRDTVHIVVLQADDRQFGLVVDEVQDTEEIVVKPLGKELKAITAFAGATIMGDGRVALILDVVGIAQRAGVIAELRERSLTLESEQSEARRGNAQALLLFQTQPGARMALPLSLVARLEEFPRDTVEHAGNASVVQYRGEILPLVPLGEVLGARGVSSDGPLQVVVYTEQGQSAGIVVHQILDIVEEQISIKPAGARPGVLGTAVIQGRVTEILDARAAIRRFDPRLFDDRQAAE